MKIRKKICEICNKKYAPNGNRSKWCNECKTIKFKCKICGKTKTIYRSKKNEKGRGSFCSKSCGTLYKYKTGIFKAGHNGVMTAKAKKNMCIAQQKRFKYTKSINYIILKSLEKYLKEKKIIIVTKNYKTPKSITPRLRFEILNRDNFTCQYCGKKAPNVKLHIDHIIPKSINLNNDKQNLITACSECNLGKSNIFIPFACGGSIPRRIF